jgi:hypothetical protein
LWKIIPTTDTIADCEIKKEADKLHKLLHHLKFYPFFQIGVSIASETLGPTINIYSYGRFKEYRIRA